MTHVSRADAEILATLVRRFRPRAGEPGHWNQAGTVKAIQECKATLSETAIALIRLACDPSVRTPALLNSDGHWWHRAAKGEQPSEAAARYRQVMCGAHPKQPAATCQPCADARGPELTPEQIAAFAAECRRQAQQRMDEAANERRAIAERRESAT